MKKMEKYHVGHEIEKELRAQGKSARWLADKICLTPQAVYDIFKRKYISTARLIKIQRALERDFFMEYSKYIKNGGVVADEEDESVIKERFEVLMPEDKLHVLNREMYYELAEEFVMTEHHKPLIIYANDWAAQTSVINNVADAELGIGKVHRLDLKDERKKGKTDDEITQLVKAMPYPIIQVVSPSGDNDFSFLVSLAQVTGKKVFAYCGLIQTINNYTNSPEYHDTTIEPFGAWHEQIHFALVDDNRQSYRQTRQLFLADWGEDILSFLKAFMPDVLNDNDNDTILEWLNNPESLYEVYRAWLDTRARKLSWLKDFSLMYLDDGLNIKQEGSRWTVSLPVDNITEYTYKDKLMNNSLRQLSMWIEIQNDRIVGFEGSLLQSYLGDDTSEA